MVVVNFHQAGLEYNYKTLIAAYPDPHPGQRHLVDDAAMSPRYRRAFYWARKQGLLFTLAGGHPYRIYYCLTKKGASVLRNEAYVVTNHPTI